MQTLVRYPMCRIFSYPDKLDRDHVGEVERRERAWSLVKEISSRQQEIASNESALNAVCHRIQNKVEKTMQVCEFLLWVHCTTSELPL